MNPQALLFTDVVDSTARVATLGDAAAAALWAGHDRLARDLLALHGGREIDRSDGFFVLFDDVAAAAAFARGYHAALETMGLHARVGVHVGEVTLRTNPPEAVVRGAKPLEVEGLAKPLAARVMSVARGGQTLLSGDAAAALKDRLPAGAVLQGHGHWRLKDLADPVELAELGDAGARFEPPPDGEKAYRVVRDGELWLPRREIRHNLAPERDAFIGRGAELAELSRRLDAGQRLVTVLGVGGTGKTRLVRRYGRAWLGEWPGGVAFCDLSEARSLEGICYAVAAALDVPLGKDDPVIQLGHAIAGRGRCLVILDNVEQVVAHAAATLGLWLDRAAMAAFVVTTRERTGVPGEAVFLLEPMALDSDAVALFEARAKAQRPDVVLDAAARASVHDIVRLLDGLPLAIELAAARVRVLSAGQIVQRLKDRFALLAGARGAASRQATLRAAIDWSWELLQSWEQSALAQCAVFEGGFTLEAAEAVLDLAGWREAPPVMDVVQALVDKSLLRAWMPEPGARLQIAEPHFGMYLSIHEYAGSRLDALGLRPATEERHGRHYASLGTTDAIDVLSIHGGTQRRQALALDLDNLVASCRRAVARADGIVALQACRAAWEVLEIRGPCRAGVELASEVLRIPGLACALEAQARQLRGLAAWRSGLYPLARQELTAARESWHALGEPRSEATALGALGNVAWSEGRIDEALALDEQALAMQAALGHRVAEGTLLGNIGNVRFRRGELQLARETYERALAIHREVGNRLVEGSVLGNLAGALYETGDRERATQACRESLAVAREVGDRRVEATATCNLGLLLNDLGRADEAEGFMRQGLELHRQLGDRIAECGDLVNLGNTHVTRGATDAASEAYEQAVSIARDTGSRWHEATALGNLGEMRLLQGRLDEAAEMLPRAEAMMREARADLGLAKTLLARSELALHLGDSEVGRTVFHEAQAIAQRIGAGPDSDLGRNIGRVAKLTGW